jgi:Histidine kinase
MFKSLGNLLHKTPWWAIALMGLFVFLVLALFTIPFNLIALSDSGKTASEQRAIQREVDRTFGDSALNVAERVVKAMAERTEDSARKVELEIALADIDAARNDLNETASETRRVRDETQAAAKQLAKEARDAAREARDKAKEDAREAKSAAKEKIEQLRAAREEARNAQKRVGINDEGALASFDKAIAEAEVSLKDATQRIRDINSGKFKPNIPDVPNTTPPTAPTSPTKATPKSSSTESKITIKTTDNGNPNNNKDLTLTKKNEQSVKIDGVIGGTRIKGDIEIDAPEKSQLSINGVDVMTPLSSLPVAPRAPAGIPAPPAQPSPPLTPELRDNIRKKVASDVKRLGIGSALIMAFIPLFIMLVIAKYYIGRSRRAIEVANVKTKEAEFANVNRQIVEAKLMALQAQVEPHFLYNTLANVQALTEVDPPLANKMTGHLIQYLRAALPKMRENISTVGQEMELVTAYLNILKIRMGERLAFSVDIPADCLALPFPPLMLPSLVENAIKHGLEPLREGGRIDVVAIKVGEGAAAKIRMMVKDTGRGLTDAPIQAGGGVGLTNVRERLLALFGDAASLTLESNQPKGVIASIEVPAVGGVAFSAGQSTNNGIAQLASQPVVEKSWSAKTINAAARTHSVWVNILMKMFVGIIAILLVVFAVAMVGLATDMFPLNIGDTKISGMEGMALGTIALIFTFGLLSVVALIMIAIIYGLGFLIVGLVVGVPLLVLASIFPVLLPFIAVGGVVYWWWWRKNKKLRNNSQQT